MAQKLWGKNKFWGVSSEFDPDWVLDEEQIKLRDALIELCRTKIRPLAIKSDQTYEFPRESLRAMSELGLMGLIVPKEFGGLGQSHTCAVMILETLARYGCPSTAMIYSMHLQATAILSHRYHDNKEIQNLFRRMNSETLLGTSSYSDAATGGHFWFPLSSKSQKIDEDHYKVFKFNSWTTSAGYADFYVFQTPTPDVERDHSNLTGFFVYKDEVRASTDNWSALGLHGNQSGPLVFEGVLQKSRMIGKPGNGRSNNDETGAIYFLFCTSAVWNGIAMGCIDLARKHTRQKTHGDVGKRVCDYPPVQDYVGRCITETNGCRAFLFMLASQLDKTTNNNDWRLHEDLTFSPRSSYLLWMMQVKHNTSENVSRVTDLMLKACGGDGYKTETGIERLLRDSKAGGLMAPTNEVIRNFMGRGSLIGLETLDMWDKISNHQMVHHEIKKMCLEEKQELLKALTEDIERGSKPISHPYQDTDFDNPFNTAPPKHIETFKTRDAIEHNPALNPDTWTALRLASRTDINSSMASFNFAFSNTTDHSGCLPGQYVQIRIPFGGRFHERYFSPVSPTNIFGSLELVLKFESHGIVSNFLKNLKIGESVDFRGPCGGFEYESGNEDEITLIASGSGVTPGLQIIRTMVHNQEDKLKITLIYSGKDVDDFMYREELQDISKRDPRLRLILTVGEAPDDWDDEVGFVDVEMIKKYISKPNAAKHKILLCGGPTMTISCLHSLQMLKYPAHMIFIYGQFGTEQIRMVYGRNVRLSGHRSDNAVSTHFS